jgi:hypothetical protein
MARDRLETKTNHCTKGNIMRLVQIPTVRNRFITCAAALAGLLLLTASVGAAPSWADSAKATKTRMSIDAGTVFNLDTSVPMPWHHQVRGLAQVSNLGNCKVSFDVFINAGATCDGGHVFCLSGEMTITTLTGDALQCVVAGWADPDPKDPKTSPSMFILHYDVAVKAGTGSLMGAVGAGDIEGAFLFSDDPFCTGYAGVATWQYEGVLILPREKN